MWQYNYTDYNNDFLAHHGIKGQKWGVRRYQNEDGSLTPEGQRRYGVGEARTAKQVRKELNDTFETIGKNDSKSHSIYVKYNKAARKREKAIQKGNIKKVEKYTEIANRRYEEGHEYERVAAKEAKRAKALIAELSKMNVTASIYDYEYTHTGNAYVQSMFLGAPIGNTVHGLQVGKLYDVNSKKGKQILADRRYSHIDPKRGMYVGLHEHTSQRHYLDDSYWNGK